MSLLKNYSRYLEQKDGGFVRMQWSKGAPFAWVYAACYGRSCDNAAAILRCVKRLRKWHTLPDQPLCKCVPLDIDENSQGTYVYKEN